MHGNMTHIDADQFASTWMRRSCIKLARCEGTTLSLKMISNSCVAQEARHIRWLLNSGYVRLDHVERVLHHLV